MGPDDHYFAAENTPSLEQMAEILRSAGASEAYCYAYSKTGGLMLTPENRHLVSDKDNREFESAMEEYERDRVGRNQVG